MKLCAVVCFFFVLVACLLLFVFVSLFSDDGDDVVGLNIRRKTTFAALLHWGNHFCQFKTGRYTKIFFFKQEFCVLMGCVLCHW